MITSVPNHFPQFSGHWPADLSTMCTVTTSQKAKQPAKARKTIHLHSSGGGIRVGTTVDRTISTDDMDTTEKKKAIFMYNRVTSVIYNRCHVRFFLDVDEREWWERWKLSDMQQTVYKALIDIIFVVISMLFVTYMFCGLVLWKSYIDNLEIAYCISCV